MFVEQEEVITDGCELIYHEGFGWDWLLLDGQQPV